MQVSRRTFAKAVGLGFSVSRTYDVAVIGAGVFGSWSAYLLRQSGRSVVLVEGYGPGNSRASSGGESRIIRMGYGKDEIYTRFSRDSLSMWQQFQRRVNQPLFIPTGVLWISRPDDERTTDSKATLERAGVRFEPLEAAELARRYPQIRLYPGAIGVLEPESGALMARKAVQAVVTEAVRNAGCAYLPEAVMPPEGKGHLSSVRTSAGTAVSAGKFVFACGPWLPKVFPRLLGKRIFPTRQEVFFFGTPPGDRRFFAPQFPVWIDFSDPAGPYGFPVLDERGFKLAFDVHGPPFDPDTGTRLLSAEGLERARRYVAERFPALKGAPLVESRVCQYENTSSGDFLIDRHPDFDNVWIAGGGSGHGFKHGPAVGRYVTALLNGNARPEPRFAIASKTEQQNRSVY